MCIVGFIIFFKDNVNEWVTFACDGTGPADESKRTKRVQGCSRLNWLSCMLIIVSWHIHFNKLLMPLTPVCCFANWLQGLQFPSSLIIFKFTESHAYPIGTLSARNGTKHTYNLKEPANNTRMQLPCSIILTANVTNNG